MVLQPAISTSQEHGGRQEIDRPDVLSRDCQSRLRKGSLQVYNYEGSCGEKLKLG